MQFKTVLPSGLSTWINSEAKTTSERDRLTRLSRYVFNKYLYNGVDFESPIEISAEHFRNQVGTHYKSDLDRMKRAGVMTAVINPKTGKESYYYFSDTRLGQCKKYYFAPEYILTEPKIVEYNERLKKKFDSDQITRSTVDLVSRLKLDIDARKLERFVVGLVTPDFIRERCKINKEIPPDFYHWHYYDVKLKRNKQAKTPLDRDRLIEIAQRSGKELILYRDKCYIAPVDAFIWRRVINTRCAYLDMLVKLKNVRQRQNIYCRRNDTNQRLDTNLTNLPSILIPRLSLDGERLVSIDLSNSQFTLLAYAIESSAQYSAYLSQKHWEKNDNTNIFCNPFRESHLIKSPDIIKSVIHKHIETITTINVTHFFNKSAQKVDITHSLPSDLRHFIKSTKNGLFYDQLAELMSIEQNTPVTRADAKKAMFITAFSAHRYNPRPKQLLKAHYPSLVLFMNEFKKIAGNNQLAIMLQEIESAIFIDVILAQLLESGYRVFSKHDSILCKESDLDAVSKLVRAKLDNILGAGGYRLKIEKS